ncbi:MAG: hypothetical protein KGD63_12055 [Candidatus Lokiarchaeota archaeon]|nr:hypothetical protein [Candidatus Lokiarchaeota archaeon]
MDTSKDKIAEELLLKKFEKLSLNVEKLTDEITQLKHKMDKNNKINRSFGLKSLKNSVPLDFAKDVMGIGSPTKRYLLSIRGISEEWKGKKNDFLIAIRQQEKETHTDLKSLGIRIPIDDIKSISVLSREILSLLYISCELKGIEINNILRELLSEINQDGLKMVREIKNKML